MLFSPGLLQRNRIARRLERPRDRRLPLLDGQLPPASAVGAKKLRSRGPLKFPEQQYECKSSRKLGKRSAEYY